MTHYLKLSAIALLAAILLGCGSVSGMFSSDSDSTSKSSQEAPKAETEAEGNTYLASDDYQDEDEVHGTLLKKSDYAKMTEDIQRNGEEFDWGWVAPNLNLSKYSTVRITVRNDSASLDPDIKKVVRKTFARAMERLGLKVVPDSSPADLELALAIVDYNADSTFAWVTVIKPFIELELRLKNLKSGADLALIRDQEHSSTPDTATLEYASDLLKFLK